ncbi:MAG: aminotransferase class III-fold pyridoxal phosphate-dependent enzyme [Acidimicrobiia bacterium]|nr:aminotransferase class III-fold pyridoxal phosphate-dependent enzyme [Acidimicrobiia bacterium]MDH3463745.1 aminotransferase class III-fold pyridoxal phosphate-dependent enzyme [Acidimicrobiia bacterium]
MPQSSVPIALVEKVDHQKAAYAKKRPNSLALHQRALGPLPGGNSRSQLHFDPFPFYHARAEAQLLTDVDGFSYIDVVNNYTSLIHGHPTTDMIERLSEAGGNWSGVGIPTELEIRLAEIITSRVPSVDQVRFTNSGTEAGLYAIRAARVFTGRDDLIKAEGGYSGGWEAAQVSVKHVGDARGESVAEPGIPSNIAGSTHVFAFNDIDHAVGVIERHGSKSAAVIIEPMQGSAGAIPPDPGFLEAIRDATVRTGCLLVFDEVMTLRLGLGGLQGAIGVIPDMTIMGKIIGGGLPVGAFGGRADIMAATDPRSPGSLMHAGTFNANPVTMAAGIQSMEMLDAEAFERINGYGDDLRSWINAEASERELALVSTGVGNIVQVHCSPIAPKSYRDSSQYVKQPLDLLFFELLERGVFAAPGRILMTMTTPMTEETIGRIKTAFSSAFDLLESVGYRLVSAS